MQQSPDCLLCLDPIKIMGLLPCNHRHICYVCTIKLYENSFCVCPICKIASKQILFTNDLESDYDFLLNMKTVSRSRIKPAYLYLNNAVQEVVEKENKFVCSFGTCGYTFNTLNTLKKHLNEEHRRQFCDLCLESKKCLLSEQILYAETDLITHLSEGEFEDTGVISLYHPFCEFCRVRFYDEDAFLRHLKSAHEQCHFCNKKPAYKYTYYKDYKTLELHFDSSHFMCKHKDCLQKKMTNVFESEDFRDFHYAQAHLGQRISNKTKRRIECNDIAGFNQTQVPEAPIVKDGYGKSVQKQLISLMRQTELATQPHQDGYIDVREIYHKKASGTKNFGVGEVISRMHLILEYQKTNDLLTDFTITDIDLFRPLSMKSLTREQLKNLIDQTVSNPAGNQLKRIFFQTSEYKNPEEFNKQLTLTLNKTAYRMTFFYIFPQLIRFFKDTTPRKKSMDDYYARCLLELPVKTKSVIRSFFTYSDQIMCLKSHLEAEILTRILNKTISLTKYVDSLLQHVSKQTKPEEFYIQRDRVKNIYHMIQKVKTQDLLKLNWLLKVGLSLESHEYITSELYFSTPQNFKQGLSKVTNSDLCLLYVYIKGCGEALQVNKNIFDNQKAKEDINVLREFVSDYKESLKSNLEKSEPKISELINKIQRMMASDSKGFQAIKPIIDEHDNPSLPVSAPSTSITFGNSIPEPVTKKKKRVKEESSDEELPSLPGSGKASGWVASLNQNNNSNYGFGNPTALIRNWDEKKSTAVVKKQMPKTVEEQAKESFLDRFAKKSGTTPSTNTSSSSTLLSQAPPPPKPRPAATLQTPKMLVNLTQAEQLAIALSESQKTFQDEQRKTNGTLITNKNVFELLEEEQEQQPSRKKKKNKQPSSNNKSTKIEPTVKRQQPDNTHLFVNARVIDDYDYPALSAPAPQPAPKQTQVKNKKKGKVEEVPFGNHTGIKWNQEQASKKPQKTVKQTLQEEDSEFPTLGGGDSTWISNVAAESKNVVAAETRVRKKKGKKFTEEVVDLSKL